MIYITGDTHGDFSRLVIGKFPQQQGMTKNDFVIICGDFGIWNYSISELKWLNWLNERPFTTLFLDGNHENFELLAEYPVSEWRGGKVQFINDSVIHLMRGQIYELHGRSFFTMGGASSHDISDGILNPNAPDFILQKNKLDARNALYRINHISWWKEEMPSKEEYETALHTLDIYNWKVDYILSHCCPTSISDILGKGLFQPDPLTDFLEEIKKRCDFRQWFFGHYHKDRVVEDKYILLYTMLFQLCWD